MKRGVSGSPIPSYLPFAAEITQACSEYDFPPCLAYAVKINETGLSNDPAEMQIGSVGDYMPDGSNAGHGIFQLTSSWPASSNPADNWSNASANARYALAEFLQPAWLFWTSNTELEGEYLVKVIAASFNAGLLAAWNAHLSGNVDAIDTDDYGARAVRHYLELVAGGTIVV